MGYNQTRKTKLRLDPYYSNVDCCDPREHSSWDAFDRPSSMSIDDRRLAPEAYEYCVRCHARLKRKHFLFLLRKHKFTHSFPIYQEGTKTKRLEFWEFNKKLHELARTMEALEYND